MSARIRTERDAYAALAQSAQTRADWRAILAARDAKRAARRIRQTRRASSGFAHLAYMLAIIAASLATLGAGAYVAHEIGARIVALPSCDSPIVEAETRADMVGSMRCRG